MIYVGIDIAKDKHDCCILGSDGEILISPFTIQNTLQGFDQLYEKIWSLTQDLEEIKVVLEATGHYHLNLLRSLLDNSLPSFVINPLHTNLFRKGQSLRKTKTDKVDATSIAMMLLTDRTLKPYAYIDNNLLSARNIDLPRKVRLRPRKAKSVGLKVDKACRIGRTWKDYCDYMALHPDTPVVQIDSVEGIKGGKVLLTIHFVNSSLMLAFLRDSNDSQSVIDIFDRLYLELGSNL